MLRWALSLCWQRPILQGGSWKATMRRLPIWLRSVTSVQCQLLTGHWWCLRQPPSGSGCSWLQARPIFAAQLWLFLATRSMFSINKVEGDLFIFWKEWHHRTVSCLCHLFSKCAKVSFLSQLIGSTQNSVQADECNKYVGLASGTCSQEIVSKGYQLPPASYDLIKGPSFLLNMLYNLALHPVALYPPKPHWRGCCLNVMDCGSASLEHSRPPLVHRATAEVIGFFLSLWVCQCCWNLPIHRWENFWSTKNRDLGKE